MCRKDELISHFEKYGKIEDVYIPMAGPDGRNKGFGFVRFLTEDEARNAVDENGSTINGVEINVEYVGKRPPREYGFLKLLCNLVVDVVADLAAVVDLAVIVIIVATIAAVTVAVAVAVTAVVMVVVMIAETTVIAIVIDLILMITAADVVTAVVEVGIEDILERKVI